MLETIDIDLCDIEALTFSFFPMEGDDLSLTDSDVL